MTAQIDLLEQDYRHDTHMFNSMLRAYAARAIAVFSAEGKFTVYLFFSSCHIFRTIFNAFCLIFYNRIKLNDWSR